MKYAKTSIALSLLCAFASVPATAAVKAVPLVVTNTGEPAAPAPLVSGNLKVWGKNSTYTASYVKGVSQGQACVGDAVDIKGTWKTPLNASDMTAIFAGYRRGLMYTKADGNLYSCCTTYNCAQAGVEQKLTSSGTWNAVTIWDNATETMILKKNGTLGKIAANATTTAPTFPSYSITESVIAPPAGTTFTEMLPVGYPFSGTYMLKQSNGAIMMYRTVPTGYTTYATVTGIKEVATYRGNPVAIAGDTFMGVGTDGKLYVWGQTKQVNSPSSRVWLDVPTVFDAATDWKSAMYRESMGGFVAVKNDGSTYFLTGKTTGYTSVYQLEASPIPYADVKQVGPLVSYHDLKLDATRASYFVHKSGALMSCKRSVNAAPTCTDAKPGKTDWVWTKDSKLYGPIAQDSTGKVYNVEAISTYYDFNSLAYSTKPALSVLPELEGIQDIMSEYFYIEAGYAPFTFMFKP